MALFAGDHGIMTGEELTYDYNFEYVVEHLDRDSKLISGSPFSQKNVQTCHCGAPSCRGFLGPKPNKTTARTSRSASADLLETASEPKRKKSTGLLNNARRSIQSLLAFEPSSTSADNSRKRKSTGSASVLNITKKRRRNTDTPDLDHEEDQEDDFRIPSSSTGATLVEQDEPKVPRGQAGQAGQATGKASGIPKRRNTIDALRGAAQKLKRSGSTLRMQAHLHPANEKEAPADETEEKHATTVSRSTRAAYRSSRVPKLEKLELDFAADEQEQAADEDEDVMGKAAVFGQTEDDTARRPTTSASTSSVIFPGIVRSVKGSRRVAAAKRAGMKIGKKVEKSMRVVTDDAGGDDE